MNRHNMNEYSYDDMLEEYYEGRDFLTEADGDFEANRINETLYIYYQLTISLEDKDEVNIYVSKELRDFFIEHERYEDDFLPDDYYNDNFFSIDISEKDIDKLEKLCKSPEEKKLLNDIKELNISYLNIEPHTIIGC